MTVKLGSLCQFINGGTPSKDVDAYFRGSIPWITSADITGPIADAARSFITPEAVQKSATNLVKKGTVLLVTRTGVGKVAIAGSDLCFSQDITAILPDAQRLDAGYLVQFLKTQQSYFVRYARGATIKGVTRDVVTDLDIPLPSLTEQRRIASILEKADTLRTKRREALAQLDCLAQSIFVEMFGDPVTNPKGWPMESLTEVCHCYSGGTPSKANAGYWQGTLPWFSAKDLKADNLFDSQDHISPSVIQTTNLKLVPANTVAIVVRGMILAHTFPVSVLRVPATINQDLKALLPKRPIRAQFLAACIRAQEGFVLEKVSEAGHGTKRLDTLGLQEVRIPQVCDSLQMEFELRYAAVEQLIVKQSTTEAQASSLFASLQHRAFRGEL